jgi:hypothetical protein
MHGRRSAREGWWRAAQRSLNANMIGLHAVRPPDPAPPHFFVLRTAKSVAHVAGNGIEPKASLCMPISVASATASGSVHSSRPDNMVCGHCFERARCRRIVACISCAFANHHTRNLRSRRGCRLPPSDLTSPPVVSALFRINGRDLQIHKSHPFAVPSTSQAAITATSQQSRFHMETLETACQDVDLRGVQLAVGDRELLADAHLRLSSGVRYGLVGRLVPAGAGTFGGLY